MGEITENLISTIERILAGHSGKDQAIRCTTIRQILLPISPDFQTINEKQIRMVIGLLRDKGRLVCSVGDASGYFTASSRTEFEEFKTYYLSFPLTMLERVRKMDAKAREQWGEGTQIALL